MTEATEKRQPVLNLGIDSTVTNAELVGYWVVTPTSSRERARISDSRLIDCDLRNSEWGNFFGCTIVGGHLPAGGRREDAVDCTVEDSASNT